MDQVSPYHYSDVYRCYFYSRTQRSYSQSCIWRYRKSSLIYQQTNYSTLRHYENDRFLRRRMAHWYTTGIIARSFHRTSICSNCYSSRYPRSPYLDYESRNTCFYSTLQRSLYCSSLDHAIPHGLKSLCRDSAHRSYRTDSRSDNKCYSLDYIINL